MSEAELSPSAHPRSRGENYSELGNTPSMVGSSPLTRGKRLVLIFVRSNIRLIPAHAGKTPRRKRSPRGDRAHPRSRGENSLLTPMDSLRYGSSPLTRGKRTVSISAPPAFRLIPAHAGKTLNVTRRRAVSAAHPRSRGENGDVHNEAPIRRGSSPLTRGKLITLTLRVRQVRLIPAHAGKTARTRSAP